MIPKSGTRFSDKVMRNQNNRAAKPLLILFGLCVSAAPALAQEPAGCDKFKWPLDKERATLTGSDLPKLASGSRAQWPLPFAATVTLLPFAEVRLPIAPERAPKSNNTFAGFIEASAPAQKGTYKITLSSEGWIDVRAASASNRSRRPVRPAVTASARASSLNSPRRRSRCSSAASKTAVSAS